MLTVTYVSTTCAVVIDLQSQSELYVKLTLKMIIAQVVETSVTMVTVNNNSPIQDYVHSDDQTQPTFKTTIVVYYTRNCYKMN